VRSTNGVCARPMHWGGMRLLLLLLAAFLLLRRFMC